MQTATLERIHIPHGCVDGHGDDVVDGSVESSQEVGRPQPGRQSVPPDGADDYYYYDYDCCVVDDDDSDADGDSGDDDDSVLDVVAASPAAVAAARAPTDARNDDADDGEFCADAVVLDVD